MKQGLLKPLVQRKQKRLGRGHGSGKVKTSGRGTKGQNARGKVPLGFEGGQLALSKRLPFLRGKSKNDTIQKKPRVIPVSALNVFAKNAVVSVKSLMEKGIVRKNETAVKILGDTKPLNVAVRVEVMASKSAKKSIEDAGGTLVLEK